MLEVSETSILSALTIACWCGLAVGSFLLVKDATNILMKISEINKKTGSCHWLGISFMMLRRLRPIAWLKSSTGWMTSLHTTELIAYKKREEHSERQAHEWIYSTVLGRGEKKWCCKLKMYSWIEALKVYFVSINKMNRWKIQINIWCDHTSTLPHSFWSNSVGRLFQTSWRTNFRSSVDVGCTKSPPCNSRQTLWCWDQDSVRTKPLLPGLSYSALREDSS